MLFVGEVDRWGMGLIEVMDYTKMKLCEGRWNIHRMVYEVTNNDGWSKIKDLVVKRAKKEPILAVCYMISDKMTKHTLEGLYTNVTNDVKPVHCHIICAPFYSFDWNSATVNAKSAWTTSSKFCSSVAFDKHINVINVCKAAHDKNYVDKDQLYFIKLVMNDIKGLLPPPNVLKTKKLENGVGYADTLSDEDEPVRVRYVATDAVAQKTISI